MARTWLGFATLALFVGCARVPQIPGPSATLDSARDTGTGPCGPLELAGQLDEDRVLRAGCTYTLVGRVDVGDPIADAVEGGQPSVVTLTIEPGTIVEARVGTVARLVVHRSARLVAEGLPNAPIVFTSSRDPGERRPGDWGGIVLTGTAPTHAGAIAAVPAQGVFGGTDDDHDSGVLEHVRIEWAGAPLSTGTRMAGLGLFGVGRGTRVQSVQVHRSAGDGLMVRGGRVAVTKLLVTGPANRGVAFDDGWSGVGQYWIVQQAPGRGAEAIDGRSSTEDPERQPLAAPVLTQLTLIGQGAPGGTNPGDIGMGLRSGLAGRVANVVAVGFDGGDLSADATAFANATAGTLLVDTGRLGSAVPFVPPELSLLPKTWSDVVAFDLSSVVGDLQSVEAPELCTDLTGAVSVDGPQIEPSDVIGGCGIGDDWTAGWTTRALPGDL